MTVSPGRFTEIEKRASYFKLFSTIAQHRRSLSLAAPPLAWLRLVTTLWPVAASRRHIALARRDLLVLLGIIKGERKILFKRRRAHISSITAAGTRRLMCVRQVVQ